LTVRFPFVHYKKIKKLKRYFDKCFHTPSRLQASPRTFKKFNKHTSPVSVSAACSPALTTMASMSVYDKACSLFWFCCYVAVYVRAPTHTSVMFFATVMIATAVSAYPRLSVYDKACSLCWFCAHLMVYCFAPYHVVVTYFGGIAIATAASIVNDRMSS
jgi:hypothetical protein